MAGCTGLGDLAILGFRKKKIKLRLEARALLQVASISVPLLLYLGAFPVVSYAWLLLLVLCFCDVLLSARLLR